MRRIQVLLAFITVICLVQIAGWAFAGDGKAQGQPFQALQQQINELKAQTGAIQGAIKVSDDTGQFIGTLVGLPEKTEERCNVFIPSLGKFANLNASGIIYTGILWYSTPNCTGEPLLEGINHHWLVSILNGTEYNIYTGGAFLGTFDLLTASVRYTDGSCKQINFPAGGNYFEAVQLDAATIPFQLPFVTPYHYE